MIFTMFLACNRGGEQKMENLRQGVEYGWWLHFNFRIMVDDELVIPHHDEIVARVNPNHQLYSPYYTEIAFFHSEAEALDAGKSDNVILAWPGERNFSQGLVNGINLTVLLNEIDLNEYDLNYPITVENLVDDWEAVYELWREIFWGLMLSYDIWGSAREFGAEAFQVEIELFHLVENPEIFDQIISRGEEIGKRIKTAIDPLDPLLDIFNAVGGNVEAFFDATNHMEAEGLTVEQLLEELRE